MGVEVQQRHSISSKVMWESSQEIRETLEHLERVWAKVNGLYCVCVCVDVFWEEGKDMGHIIGR